MIHEPATWRCHITVAKFYGDWEPGAEPYEVAEYDHNMLMYGGISNIWQCLIGNGVGTAGNALTFFSQGNAAIGVGNSTTASTQVMTNLQGASRLRKLCPVGYPEHTAGTASANATLRFRSTFDTTEANFAWDEAAVFNSATDAVGRMLNRKVQAMGTKTSSSSWQITFDITITSTGP